MQLGELQSIQEKLLALGYRILAVSPDQPDRLRASIEAESLGYTLLSDSPMHAAQAFGLAFRVDEATLRTYEEFGIDLEASSGEDHHLLPVPAAYVVDAAGTIRFGYVNPDHRTRIAPAVLLAAAEAALKE